ncbi:YmfK family protein [Lederbergia lenta]|uniref:Amino acid-binding ACT domain-containing protein n=1 Tax=Lederbergia lenta TaxID=1467 RepID=A0A2X4WJR5_LEDLE|nr:YmfK family protein [Lederbergia lenta]MCM3110084.1 YmfK family protein [Lederbergia lenta]MEC2324347.1 YmfK family protein [Lederbergia lenta]SQI60108.1 amino acid-binding ACT domain-containing protein [Lederbergia lenta]
MDRKEWYLEYEITIDRPGLLGDISSLLGMLSINIVSINGVDSGRRGLLLRAHKEEQILRLESILETVETVKVTKIREPKLRDRLAVRHGRYIQRDMDDKKTFQFVRDELGLLVDFMAELFKQEGHKLIGIRGMPRVGKTESVVAASVCANKKWLFVSSTLLKQTIRKQLIQDEYDSNNIFILDGIVSRHRADEQHWQLVREIMRLPAVKVIEHPDIFVAHSEYSMEDFDYIIELRNNPEEAITYEIVEKNNFFNEPGMGFDF